MKKTIAVLMALSSVGMGAELVAGWYDFSETTASGYTLSLTSAASVNDGVLALTHTGNPTNDSVADATIDLTSAGLTMDKGFTVSITLSNLSIWGDSSKNPAGIFGLGTGTEGKAYTYLVSYDCSGQGNKYDGGYDGSKAKLDFTAADGAVQTSPRTDTPVTLTVTFLNTDVIYYVDGNQIGTFSLKVGQTVNNSVVGDYTDDVITTLAIGSWAGKTANGHANGNFYNLAIYNGAMSASEVKALIPEPATATLSLLALAGMAMRRRRY